MEQVQTEQVKTEQTRMETGQGQAEQAQMEQPVLDVRISVRDLVEFILRSGDIDNRKGGGFSDKEAMQEGSRIHRKIQGRMGSNYRAEVPLSVTLPGNGYTLTVEGRADGIFHEEETTDNGESQKIYCIDEIKSMYRELVTLEKPYPVHLAQAKCYAHIYAQQKELDEIDVQMTYCNIETEEIRRFRERFTAKELDTWFTQVTDAYRKWAEYQKQWRELRQSSLQELEFPFPWRQGQKKLAMDVYRTILRKKKLFIQAPTGTGKTLSTVYPAVKAVGAGIADRIFYATAKTITRTVAEEAFALLRESGMRLKMLTITAKEKICPCEELECNPDDCPYAKGHYDRVNDAVFDMITGGESFDREAILQQAEKWQVCPFEMSLDVSLWVDGVICDYNYIFDPRARLKRFFAEGAKGNYIFLIDEAHNLVDRGREMFSAALYKEEFLQLKKEVKAYSRKLTRALERCNGWMLELKRESSGVKLHESVGMFPVYLMNLCGQMEEFLENSHNAELNQKILDLYFPVRSFLEVADRLDENYVIYSEIGEDGRFMLRLYCVDISANLQECLDRGRSTVFFSATLLPIQYYKSLLSTQKDNYAVYAEPTFRPENRLVLLATDTSSRYTNRSEGEYRKMAEYVLQVMRAKRGNYMVFFSSYRMMEDVAEQFAALCETEQEAIEVALQEPGMTERAREEFLSAFETPHSQGLVGFCVMGGIFGEGIDLREERLIGAVVIGTGLPQVCSERELLKEFYDRRGEDGFFYAYLCPGMNKVLQSAGRVIRTDADEGVILLVDERFAKRRYLEMFPAEWENPPTCTLRTVGARLESFWAGRKEK